MEPRLIRLRDAPKYLGMNRNLFNQIVRPYIDEIWIGKRGIAFEKFDLDNWLEQYKAEYGRRPSAMRRKEIWDVERCQAYNKKNGVSGILIKRYTDKDYAKALELATMKKRKHI